MLDDVQVACQVETVPSRNSAAYESKPRTGLAAGKGSSSRPDLTNLPQGVVFMVGETWDFQAWYRDGFATTSNFTDGIEVMFR